MVYRLHWESYQNDSISFSTMDELKYKTVYAAYDWLDYHYASCRYVGYTMQFNIVTGDPNKEFVLTCPTHEVIYDLFFSDLDKKTQYEQLLKQYISLQQF